MFHRCPLSLAVVLGLTAPCGLMAQEPARLNVSPGPVLTGRLDISPNQQAANAIAGQLQQSGQLRHYKIDVTFQNGVAELNGSVTDQVQREEALRIVQGVLGVDRVIDRLTLSAPVAQVQAAQPAPGPLIPKADMDPPPVPNAPTPEPVPIFQGGGAPGYDVTQPKMPPYAWPTYAPYNNWSRVAYPTQYPYNAWPFIGPCYPFPKVPPSWRSVKLEWMDGHWWYSHTANSHDWWKLRYW